MPKARSQDDEMNHELDDSLLGVDSDDEGLDLGDPDIDGLADDEDPDSLLNDADDDDDDDGDDNDGDDDDDDDEPDERDERIAALEERDRRREEERAAQEVEQQRAAVARQKEERTQNIQSLESDITSLTERMEAAEEEGDTKTRLKLQNDLIDKKVELRLLKAQPEPEFKEPEARADDGAPPVDAVVRKRLGSWLKENKWFDKREKAYNADAQGYAIAVGDRLAKDGYNPATKAYYRELDKAVKRRFPELFARERKQAGDAPGPNGAGRPGGRGKRRSMRITDGERKNLSRFGLDSSDKNVMQQLARVRAGKL